MAEYEEEFTYLSKFAPKFVATEEDRARRCEEGLRPHIRFQVSSFELSTYAAVLKKYLVIEKERKEIFSVDDHKNNNMKKMFRSDGRGGHNKNWQNKRQNVDFKGKQTMNQKSMRCTICDKSNHEVKNCWRVIGACLRCGQKDHKIADCPKLNETPSHNTYLCDQHPQVKARVYSLTGQEALANNDVVSSTTPIFSTFARVLFNSGASHSFITAQFVR
ncbi:uncharacterized protein LOC109838389 [Asparagus officinalis]|uniref:uncharacterized protein LOC109838389 n=1 Tax=Asparagus officinalis TaxID=4686 RepID=UPI00098DF7E0|nr:uncharacterized protein LOC109838389 [Asparagus officinalis]